VFKSAAEKKCTFLSEEDVFNNCDLMCLGQSSEFTKTIRIDRDHRRSSQRSRVTVITTWAVKHGQVGGDSGRINEARTNYATESHDLTQISRRLPSRLAADTRHTSAHTHMRKRV